MHKEKRSTERATEKSDTSSHIPGRCNQVIVEDNNAAGVDEAKSIETVVQRQKSTWIICFVGPVEDALSQLSLLIGKEQGRQ